MNGVQPYPVIDLRIVSAGETSMTTTPFLPCRAFLAAAMSFAAALCVHTAEPPKKLLVVTITTGFRHSSIDTAERILERLGKESGAFTVDFVRQPDGKVHEPPRPKEDASDEEKKLYLVALAESKAASDAKITEALRKLSPDHLKNYDGVVFANTTGDLPLPDKQGFIDWVMSGKAFIGMHGASDTFHGFRPYIEMLGAEFKTHGPQVEVSCLNEDPQHAACKHLPSSWTVFPDDELRAQPGPQPPLAGPASQR